MPVTHFCSYCKKDVTDWIYNLGACRKCAKIALTGMKILQQSPSTPKQNPQVGPNPFFATTAPIYSSSVYMPFSAGIGFPPTVSYGDDDDYEEIDPDYGKTSSSQQEELFNFTMEALAEMKDYEWYKPEFKNMIDWIALFIVNSVLKKFGLEVLDEKFFREM